MPRSRLVALAAGAIVGLGLLAEGVAYELDQPGRWVPDLLTGWTLAAGGLVAWSRRPESPSGVLLVLMGAAWFAGNFDGALVHAHRGPLVHLLLSHPSGGAPLPLVVAGYVIAVVPGVWASEPASIVLAAALMAAALAVHRSRMNAARRAALRATGLVALALAGGAVARLAVEHGAGTPTLLIYELSLVAVAVLLAASMARRTGEQAALADLVIELGSRPSGVLRDALAQTLGDPTVEVGFRLDDGATFVDAQGTPLALPHADPQRAVTFVEREGERIAALVHDPAVLRDFALVDALGTATDLAARNARLQAAVRAQLEELAVSTRRLVEVADVERRRLELRLREGPERRLQTIADELSRVDGPQAQRASEQLSAAFEDLHELAAGLHPRILSEKGLAGAVRELAARTPLTVDVAASAGPHPQAVESVAYFVCAEGLANVVKYARAATAAIEIRERDGLLTVVVSDDGAGGADASRGTGLRGLADRVAALGGSLEVESPPGAGTRLAVELPVSRS